MYSFEENKKNLDAWKEISKNPDDVFDDGVFYKGKFERSKPGFSERQHGNEDTQWNEAKRRILFVTKDHPIENGAYDIRVCDFTHEEKEGNLSFQKDQFVKNMLRITAGLHYITAKSFLSYDKVNDIEFLDSSWDASAVARINVKKHGGSSRCPVSILRKVLTSQNYAELIKQQINLLDANIIVCCGGSGIIKEFVISHCYPDAKQVNNRIYYSPIRNVWIIDSYHLKPIGNISDYNLYTGMMQGLQDALIKLGKEEPVR